jgi:integrase
MSSLTKDTHQPPKSLFWIACFNGIGSDGRVQRFKRSTKTIDRKLAQRLADEWEAAAKLAGQGRLTESWCRKVIAQIYEQAVSEPLCFRSCRAWLIEWLENTKANVTPDTWVRYDTIIHKFLDHLGARQERLLREIIPADIRSWRDKLKSSGLSSSTVNANLLILRMAFRQAHSLGYVEINVCAAIRPLTDETGGASKDVFSPQQVADLLRASTSADWAGLVLCGFYAGLRLMDCVGLRWGNVDLDEQIITVETKKTRRVVRIPVHPRLLSWLKEQPTAIGKAAVFPSLVDKRQSDLSTGFKRIMKRASIRGRVLRQGVGKGRSHSSLSFHSLRHSNISALQNAGVPLELTQELIGHASVEMSKHYAHPNVATLRAAVLKLPSIPKARAR